MKIPGLNETNLAMFAQAVRNLANGHSNAIGTFTLAHGATQTVVANPNCTTASHVQASPTSASAAGSGWYVKAVANGSFTIGHASSAATDMTFRFELKQS